MYVSSIPYRAARHPATHHQETGSIHLSSALDPGQEQSSTSDGLHSNVIEHHHAGGSQHQRLKQYGQKECPDLELINQNCDRVELLILALTLHDHNALSLVVQDS
jgi:hypothetical protein